MNKASIFFIMGVSGCGKSTVGKLLAQELRIPFFDGDDFHPQANIAKMEAGKALNDTDRQGWLESLNKLAKKHKLRGAIIACSALKESYRNLLEKDVLEQTEFVFLKGSYDEILARLQQRENHFMPAALLKSQFDTLEIPTKAITVSIANPPSEIVAKIINDYKSKKR